MPDDAVEVDSRRTLTPADRAVRAARVSVVSNSLLVAVKLAAGLVMGSVSVLSEAIHSGMDLVAAGIAFYSVRQSRRPADEHHPFGHGKVENVAGTVEALLIFAAAIWIIVEAVRKLIRGVQVEALGVGLAVMGLAAVVNILVSRHLFRVAREADSVALRADALHLSTDVWTSAGVFAGLGIMALTDYHIVDPLAALVVAVLIIHAAWDLTREAFLPLMDTSLPEDEQQVIQEIIARHSSDFVNFHRMRSRRAGPERHIDLHLVVHGDHTVAEAHALCDAIEREIEGRFPRTDVVIHVEPSSPGRRTPESPPRGPS
ncbi:MAG: cation transporter [Firmicutes bacterium]|nr:cation transporter [Bacillota bacterium]